MSVENHIIKVSFCGTFQKAVKPKRSHSPNNFHTISSSTDLKGKYESIKIQDNVLQ